MIAIDELTSCERRLFRESYQLSRFIQRHGRWPIDDAQLALFAIRLNRWRRAMERCDGPEPRRQELVQTGAVGLSDEQMRWFTHAARVAQRRFGHLTTPS